MLFRPEQPHVRNLCWRKEDSPPNTSSEQLLITIAQPGGWLACIIPKRQLDADEDNGEHGGDRLLLR